MNKPTNKQCTCHLSPKGWGLSNHAINCHLFKGDLQDNSDEVQATSEANVPSKQNTVEEIREEILKIIMDYVAIAPSVKQSEKLSAESSLFATVAIKLAELLAQTRKETLEVLKWALGSDTGSSSEALCRHMMGIEGGHNSAPSDSDDRGRCIRLLNRFPEWWDRLDEMAEYPSSKVNVFSGSGLTVREEGWKEQVPLIKKEAGLSNGNLIVTEE